ncbi:MAG: hypothetical protein HOV87_25160 [Catenulispora sp.]|nr:hypothetical protein [Catenulispora sp.]
MNGGQDFGVGFAWAVEEAPVFDATLSTVQRAAHAGVEGMFTTGVEWVLREAGLLTILERVSGDAAALHGAAAVWMEQALAARGISVRLRADAAGLAGSWRGEAARAFGEAMGACVGAVDRLASGAARTAHLVNEAGVAAGAAQDLVTGIVADAAEWAAAELAATAVADLLTLGLATIGGALAESATLAAFAARAERVSAEFATTLERLAAELAELKALRDTISGAHGLRRLRAARQAQETVTGLPGVGRAFHAAQRTADAAIGLETGLPLDADGPKGLGSVIAHTAAQEAEQIESGH